MYSSRYLQLDVFSARTGGGNPLGVVVDAAAWSDAAMQSFAAWTGLVETTFVLPPTTPDAGYRLRIFTPAREMFSRACCISAGMRSMENTCATRCASSTV